MLTPQLWAPWFDFTGGIHDWSRMARVLEHTARTHCPSWEIHVDAVRTEIDTPLRKSANATKLHAWNQIVQAAPDGTPLLLMDTDMFIQAPLDPLWELDFDIAFTSRDRKQLPINGGVVAMRVSAGVRAFFARWQAVSLEMTRDKDLHQLWKQRFGGQNQAALGAVLQSDELKVLTVAWLPCSTWNAAELAEWKAHHETARIVHIKSDLRHELFNPAIRRSPLSAARWLAPIAAKWRAAEAAIPPTS